jgi:precorrin-6B methylase 2
MANIVSRGSEPRREDVEARRLIDGNRATIERLADQFSNGAYSARKAAARAPVEPQPEGLIIHVGGGAAAAEPRPYVRVSPNKRVVAVDYETGRQMHHLGEIRRVDGRWRFVLATQANGFFAPLDDALAGKLTAMDGAVMGAGRDDDALSAELGRLLGYESD